MPTSGTRFSLGLVAQQPVGRRRARRFCREGRHRWTRRGWVQVAERIETRQWGAGRRPQAAGGGGPQAAGLTLGPCGRRPAACHPTKQKGGSEEPPFHSTMFGSRLAHREPAPVLL